MLKILAHDVVNDVTIIQTNLGFTTRYGLQIRKFDTLKEALQDFYYAQSFQLGLTD